MPRALISALSCAALLTLSPVAAFAGETPAPEGAKVYIVSPQDGATVKSPFVVRFGLTGMGVAPAGVDHAKTGHHHLIIDADAPTGEDLEYSLPADEHFRHFGGGQTEAIINLPPGRHSLQLIMGDTNHIPHNPPVISEKIHITVE